MTEIIFWNVDTQFDFMRANGNLYVQNAEKIEPNLEALTRFAEQKKIVVVNTADWHNEFTKEISENSDYITTFPKHCYGGEKGAEYVPATNPKNPYTIDWKDNNFSKEKLLAARNIVLRKDAFDIFEGNKHADKVVKLLNPKKAVVYGVATNVCDDYAVMGLIKRKIEVYVPLDAIKELPHLPLENTLNKWKDYGVKLTTVDEIVRMYEK